MILTKFHNLTKSKHLKACLGSALVTVLHLSHFQTIEFLNLPWTGQAASQYPQAPLTWSSLASVWVEHQGLVSPSIVVQPEWETPMKLKGKTQADPDMVEQSPVSEKG